ncbi:MAG: hypothetical protein KJ886_03420 [Candidatus Thermoplasmatota archaeon]|nr:hypothetical protein [Candidatus Thermoplasmatota archaeon]MCG2827363.1 hypothetical protein [Thermoplasmatales archaeon]
MAKNVKRYEIEADVFSLDFSSCKNLIVENVTFIPFSDWRERYKKCKENTHTNTGIIKVSFDSSITNKEDAFRIAKEKLDLFSKLLSYAHGHDVFCDNWVTYEVINNERKEISRSRYSIRIGNVRGGGHRVYLSKIDFLIDVLPLINDKEFVKDTSILWAIAWCNEADIFSLTNAMEIQFVMHWITLETLANRCSETNDVELLLNAEQFKVFRESLKTIIEQKIEINDQLIKKMLYKNIDCFRRRNIVDKVIFLLKQLKLDKYSDEISKLNKIRNAIIHTRSVNSNDLLDAYRKLTRINEKVIFSLLGVLDKDYIRPAIRDEKLLSR